MFFLSTFITYTTNKDNETVNIYLQLSIADKF